MTREKFQCLTCGGAYLEMSHDGTVYSHVCPPLPPDQNGVTANRQDYRNENLTQRRPSMRPSLIAEGKGVKCLTNASLSEPQWITAIKSRFPADTED